MLGRLVLALLLSGAAAGPAQAGPAEDGDTAWEAGDLAAAITAWGEALAAARTAGDPTAEVDLGLRLAAAMRQAGAVDDAATLLDQLEDAASEAGPDREARRQVALAQVDLARGRLRAAEKQAAAAFAAAQQADAPAAAATAALLLGDTRTARGDRAGADKAWAGARALFETLGDRLGQADARGRQGLAAWEAGDLGGALSHLEAAVELYRAVDHRAGEADAQAALALLLVELGRGAEAVALLEDALATARRRADVPRQARIHLALGQLRAAAGQPDDARSRLVAAREAWRALGPDRAADAAAADLAVALLDAERGAGELDRTCDIADEARRLRAVRLEAQARLACARSRDRAGRHRDAIAQVERAQDLADRSRLLDLRWRAMAAHGFLLLDAGVDEAGTNLLRHAVAELERTRAGLDADAARGFVGGHAEVYERLVAALLEQGEDVDAFLYAQRLQLLDLPPDDLSDAPEAARYQALLAQEAWLSEALAAEAEARGPESERAEALRAELGEARVAFAEEVDRLRATWADFDARVRLDPRDLEAVQADLAPGVVVVQPVLLDTPRGTELVSMVVRRDGLRVVRTPVERPVLEADWRTLLTAMHYPGMLAPGDVRAAADALGAVLLDPIADDLADAEVLALSPTGILRNLPFAALRRDGRWLVEDVALARISHVGSLQPRDAHAPRRRLSGPGLLLVGNPDGTLPGAEAEVRAIADDLPGATVLIGGAGTERALKASLGGKAAVHLATHGWVDPRQPAASFLVLSPEADPADAGPPPPERDGRLTAREIPGLGPWLEDTGLVVLSACETAVPVEPPDGAGPARDPAAPPRTSIEGLAARFQRAGVETLVGSLWKVDDEGTRVLMEGFYGELAAGRDPARALAVAQRAMIADPATADPFMWAAFVVVGDWR